jgi:hypothetical protein
VINMGAQHHTLDLSALGASGHILIGTAPARVGAVSLAALALRPHEGVLIRLE